MKNPPRLSHEFSLRRSWTAPQAIGRDSQILLPTCPPWSPQKSWCSPWRADPLWFYAHLCVHHVRHHATSKWFFTVGWNCCNGFMFDAVSNLTHYFPRFISDWLSWSYIRRRIPRQPRILLGDIWWRWSTIKNFWLLSFFFLFFSFFLSIYRSFCLSVIFAFLLSFFFFHSLLSCLFFSLSLLHYGQKQPRIQTEVLGHSLVRSLAPFTCSGLLASLAPSAALIRLLAHFAHSLARGKVNHWMTNLSGFFYFRP